VPLKALLEALLKELLQAVPKPKELLKALLGSDGRRLSGEIVTSDAAFPEVSGRKPSRNKGVHI